MANSASAQLRTATTLVAVYVLIALGTVAALVVLASTAPAQATSAAWGHAIIVAVFAILLPLRLRRARKGNARAARAVGIIAAVLVVVNVVEALLPGAFPAWMRVEMVVIAVLMAGLAAVSLARKPVLR
jgi:Na+/proline symporter